MSQILIGAVLGGVALSTVSTVGNYVVEKEVPRTKAIARDFILGAVLMMLIMQVLPESTGKLISGILAFASSAKVVSESTSALATVTAAATDAAGVIGETIGSAIDATTLATVDDLEVRVGVPRF